MSVSSPSRPSWAVLLATVVVSAAAGASSRVRAQDSCTVCHSRLFQPALRAPVEQLAASVHGRGRLSCPSCHGGLPDEPTARAHDTHAGFVPRPSPARSVEICGGCHADAARVPAGLRTDQLALYRASRHGERLAENPRVAVCPTCHGAHDVRRVRDAAAPVHPDNVSDTCASCHADSEAMQGTELPVDQYRRWRRSVHGHAALDRNTRKRPTCAACHTGHGMRHGTRALETCGRCHEELVEAFQNGPHPEAFENLGFNACVECHGNHAVQEADAALISARPDSACRRCHTEGQAPIELVTRVGGATRRAERAARQALRRDLDPPSRERVLAARRALRLALHALDADRVEAKAGEVVAATQNATVNAIPIVPASAAWLLWPAAASGVVALLGLVLWLRSRRRSA